jgi:1-deoxy-D-xylulose-5-phosphate reductoisomerase
MKSLAIIGSTGSIGKSALKIYKKNKTNFNLVLLAANQNYKKLIMQNSLYRPKNLILFDNKNNLKINNKLFVNPDSFFKTSKKIDFVISGVSGYEAIKLNFKLLQISRNLLIANKETIICGNKLFLNAAKKNKCKILPIDSEHYCIDYFLKSFSQKNQINKIYLSASGGPFLRKKINYKEKISKVLKHPTWRMGKIITVNSSTFANKVLELFEAKILFNLKKNQLSLIVEESSNVHAIISLKNSLSIPIVHKPIMEIAISNSLNLENFYFTRLQNLKLHFIKPSYKKFPLIKLGYKILKNYGEAGMILFTVLNERLVKLYLKKAINYGDISLFLIRLFNRNSIIKTSYKKIKSINDIYKIVNFANSICIKY